MASYKEQYYSLEENEMQDLIAKAKGRFFRGTRRVTEGIQ
jgi:hypothetical protein